MDGVNANNATHRRDATQTKRGMHRNSVKQSPNSRGKDNSPRQSSSTINIHNKIQHPALFCPRENAPFDKRSFQGGVKQSEHAKKYSKNRSAAFRLTEYTPLPEATMQGAGICAMVQFLKGALG